MKRGRGFESKLLNNAAVDHLRIGEELLNGSPRGLVPEDTLQSVQKNGM